ncbi:MAG TPA: hypothetical protein VF552_03450 [Allosphingosinicella sp.]
MKTILLGAAAAALTVTAAAPASAQYRGYDNRYDRRGGIDGEDIAVGVAVLGGVAAILGALDRDGGRYGYDSRYRYRDGYSAAVNSCAVEAERAGRGRVRITDVDRRSNDRFEVEGVVEGGYGGYDTRYDRRYNAREYSRDYGERFTCVAYGNGRIADFRMRDGYASRTRW